MTPLAAATAGYSSGPGARLLLANPSVRPPASSMSEASTWQPSFLRALVIRTLAGAGLFWAPRPLPCARDRRRQHPTGFAVNARPLRGGRADNTGSVAVQAASPERLAAEPTVSTYACRIRFTARPSSHGADLRRRGPSGDMPGQGRALCGVAYLSECNGSRALGREPGSRRQSGASRRVGCRRWGTPA